MKYFVFLLSFFIISCVATKPSVEQPSYFSNIHTKGFMGIPAPQQGQSMMVFSSKINTKKPALVRIKNFDGNFVGSGRYISAAEFSPGSHKLTLAWTELRGEFWYEQHTSVNFEFDFKPSTKYLVDFENGSYVIFKNENNQKIEVKSIKVGNT